MTLESGSTLGPYEIVAPIGAGGMGEVYRARDAKLDRDVAIKVLPSHLNENPDALLRFEREAKAVASLSHPNILAIHDFGAHEGRAYAVMELLDGETLRERLKRGALPVRKAVEVGVQIARGLAAAHEKGIVHRDLKPENVVLTADGRVKILDFGLARAPAVVGSGDTSSPTVSRQTDPGTVLGTAGYMSPEQVRGRDADPRSDLFSLGCVLHEMLTGARAFARDTAAETMSAILKEDPPEIGESGVAAPSSLQRLVRHCLEKSPEERFQSARDVAFDLDAALEPSGRSGASSAAETRVGRVGSKALQRAYVATALAVALAAGAWLGHRAGVAGKTAPEPSFTRLTFAQGTIWAARFTPDGKTAVYSAAWDGQPIRLYTTRADSPESTLLGLPGAHLLSVSSTGELAISVGHRFEGWMGAGTLARAPLLGGGARPVLDGVREADWTPDGSDLAVVRRAGGRERLEFPVGKVLYETGGYVSHIRFSPKGDRIAFADHPLFADNIGAVAFVDLRGRRTALTSTVPALAGIAWSPSGDEIWFTASHGSDDKSLRAVDMSGRERLLLAGLTDMILLDVSREGRLLLGRETSLRHVEALVPGSTRPREFSLRQNSMTRNISADASAVVVTEQSTPGYAVFLRPLDGSPPVRLGEGDGFGLSPDGHWVLALTSLVPRRMLLHPTGPGQSRELPNPEGISLDFMRWLPDGRIVLFGASAGRGHRGYVLDPRAGPPRPFTEEGVEPTRYWAIPVSPDGTRVVARDPQGRLNAYRFDGGPPEPIEGISSLDVPIEWSADGRALFVGRPGEIPWRIRRHELVDGRETPLTEIAPAQAAGLRLSQVFLTPDGRFWTHSYSQLLIDLYAVDGVR